jgi:hypothetical protein
MTCPFDGGGSDDRSASNDKSVTGTAPTPIAVHGPTLGVPDADAGPSGCCASESICPSGDSDVIPAPEVVSNSKSDPSASCDNLEPAALPTGVGPGEINPAKGECN